jgi:membrane protein
MKIKELVKKVRYSAPINFIRTNSKKIILPGFEGMSLYEGGKFTYEAFFRSDVTTKSAAISFRFFIALFPTIILLLSLIPYVPIENFQDNLLSSIFILLPDTANDFMENIIADLVLKKHTAVMSIGFILTIYFASNIINSVLNTFSSSYQIHVKRNPLKQRVVSFGLIIVIPVLMLIGFAIILFGESYLAYLFKNVKWVGPVVVVLLNIVKWIAVIFLFIVSTSTLYNTAFLERARWKVISSGASLATLGIILASLGLSIFINNFGAYNQLYGSIGSLIAFLMWINVSSTILIIGFELYAKTNNRYDEKSLK